MLKVFDAANDRNADADFPMAVVVSDLLRTNYLDRHGTGGKEKASDWLYDSLEAAVAAVDARIEFMTRPIWKPPSRRCFAGICRAGHRRPPGAGGDG